MTELEKVKNEIQGLRKSKQFSLLSLLLERLEGLQQAASSSQEIKDIETVLRAVVPSGAKWWTTRLDSLRDHNCSDHGLREPYGAIFCGVCDETLQVS